MGRGIFSYIITCLSTLLILTLSSPLLFSNDSIFEEIGLPDGFDMLAAPQTTPVDIYYGGRFLSSIPAEYSATTLEFLNLSEVIQIIPGIKEPQLIKEALSGSLDRHDEFVCAFNHDVVSNRGNDCLTYQPDVAGIVFDESRFRVDVLINPDFLEPARPLSERYLPPSTSDLSFYQNLNLAFAGSRSSGSSSSNETWSIAGRSLISAKEQSIESLWNYDKEQKLGINTLSLSRDSNGQSYGLGLIQSQSFGLTFTSDKTVLGGRIGSSLRTLLDNGIVQSSRLEIFRAQRGLTEVFRDGRLIHSEFQEAGNQLINTESFPSGAYDITIKVYYDNLLNQEEVRFFVKTTFLPPSDEPQYFFEAGRPVYSVSGDVWPSEQNNILLRSGYNWRTSDSSSLAIAAASTDNELLSELSYFKLGEGYHLGASIMVADRQRFGISAFSDFYLKNASLNISYRRLWSDPVSFTPSEEDYLLLGDGFYQGSISLNLPVRKGSLNLRRSYNKTDTSEERVIDGINFSNAIGRFLDYEVRFQSSLSRDNTQLKVEFGVELKQHSKYWSRQLSYKSLYNENHQSKSSVNHDNDYRASFSWYDRDMFSDKLEADGFAEKQDSRTTIGAGVRYTGRHFGSSLSINQVHPDDGEQVTSYSGAVNVNVFTDGHEIVIGGQNNNESGLLVKLNGDAEGEFDIIINGQTQGYATIGDSTLINLPAFQSYTVVIRARGESHFEYDQREYDFTLYPGNVQSYIWNIEEVLVIIGQLLDADGHPLANTPLNGTIETTVTDEDGFFQARIRSDTRSLKANLSNDATCVFSLPEPLEVLRGGVALVGAIDCL